MLRHNARRVVSKQVLSAIGVRANDCDRLYIFVEWQKAAFIPKEYDSLPRGSQG